MNTNPKVAGWYRTMYVNLEHFSHFDGEKWGVGWYSVDAARGKENLPHEIEYKRWKRGLVEL